MADHDRTLFEVRLTFRLPDRRVSPCRDPNRSIATPYASPMTTTIDRLTNETVELLQALIQNQCVNEATPESGHEVRNAELLRDEFEGFGVNLQLFETLPGRTSLIARYEGTDPDAPAICLMGHTDVVPVNPDGWDEDPFGGKLIDGEVWGRGAVDMLNLTSSMAVAFREVVRSGKRYPGDIVYFAVADEEHGGGVLNTLCEVSER